MAGPQKEYPDVTHISTTLAPGALAAARLYNFPTGSYDLVRQGHRDFLDFEVQPIIRDLQGPWIDLKGYASHLGSEKSNLTLSRNRINAVKTRISMYSSRINFEQEVFKEQTAYGESVSAGAENNDDPWWRAVDVYVYATRPATKPPPPPPPSSSGGFECLDGPRYSKWSISTPGGISYTEYVGGAANLVGLRLESGPHETRWYLVPAVVVGASAGIPLGKGPLKEILEAILNGLSYTGFGWAPFTATTPFNFRDIESDPKYFPKDAELRAKYAMRHPLGVLPPPVFPVMPTPTSPIPGIPSIPIPLPAPLAIVPGTEVGCSVLSGGKPGLKDGPPPWADPGRWLPIPERFKPAHGYSWTYVAANGNLWYRENGECVLKEKILFGVDCSSTADQASLGAFAGTGPFLRVDDILKSLGRNMK